MNVGNRYVFYMDTFFKLNPMRFCILFLYCLYHISVYIYNILIWEHTDLPINKVTLFAVISERKYLPSSKVITNRFDRCLFDLLSVERGKHSFHMMYVYTQGNIYTYYSFISSW